MTPPASAPGEEREDAVLRSLGAGTELLADLAAVLEKAPPGTVAGRVVRVDRGRIQLLTTADIMSVSTSGQSPVCVGDWCTVSGVAGADGEAAGQTDSPQLHEVLPRRTALVRQSSGPRVASQALAANMDAIMVVVPLDRPISPRQIERFLALAWDSGADPLVVLTKADLVDDEVAKEAAAGVAAVSGDLDVLLASVVSGDGMDEVAARVSGGRTVALLGTSGSGKSSLVNALMGSDAVQVGEVRQADAKGRHTTTWRELVVLPTGGALIDTPGLRELGMWVGGEGIEAAFSDVTDLALQCRFNDCAHAGEPGCAVTAAIAAGELEADRLASYRQLLGEAAFAARKNDHRLAKEAQKLWKQRTLEGRRKARPR
jgi:ribosome biogenesis GTPase / thiamine phosphate phosphatase